MIKNSKRIRYILLVMLGGVMLTLATFVYQPHQWMVTDGKCGPHERSGTSCFVSSPAAGFPLPWFTDMPAVTGEGHIDDSDIPHPIAFMLDVLIFSLALDFLIRTVKALKKST